MELRSLVMRMGRALGRFQRERGLALSQAGGGQQPVAELFHQRRLCRGGVPDLFGERMPDQLVLSALGAPWMDSRRHRPLGEEQTVHRWLDTLLTIIVGLWIGLACGGGHRRPDGASIRRTA